MAKYRISLIQKLGQPDSYLAEYKWGPFWFTYHETTDLEILKRLVQYSIDDEVNRNLLTIKKVIWESK